MEKMLIQRCLAGIPRDLDLLEQLVIEHKQFENDLSSRELEVSAPLHAALQVLSHVSTDVGMCKIPTEIVTHYLA